MDILAHQERLLAGLYSLAVKLSTVQGVKYKQRHWGIDLQQGVGFTDNVLNCLVLDVTQTAFLLLVKFFSLLGPPRTIAMQAENG